MPKETLSASKIKVLKSCSWQYWCKYILKLPDKTNDGALKGEIVHSIFECLGKKRHRKHYDLILDKERVFASEPIKRLILMLAKSKKINTKNNIDDIVEMIYRGLLYDFFGEKLGTPSELISEKEFEITVEEKDLSFKIKGFIDKLFLYENKGVVLIRDFKTNKKKYEGKEVTDNLQDYIYTLAINKLYPELKDIKMEFIFLKQSSDEDMLLEMKAKSSYELIGFQHELTEYQKYADNFNEKIAMSNLAAEQATPKDGSFSGRLLCGFATKPNEKKKDGSPKWYCTYKFAFDYFVLLNEKKEQIASAFIKADLEKKLKDNYSIIQKKYAGCPHWNKPKQNPQIDVFDLDKF